MSEQQFPPGWDAERVKRLIARYESQTEDEQVAEDEAALETQGQTTVVVPTDLMPAIRQLLAEKAGS
jgi:hypothetical protein